MPSGCCSFTGALDSHPFSPSHVASGRCVLSAAAAGALAGVVSAFAGPSRWCAGAVLDVAGCAVCASVAPNSWRIGGCAGCCGGRLTDFANPLIRVETRRQDKRESRAPSHLVSAACARSCPSSRHSTVHRPHSNDAPRRVGRRGQGVSIWAGHNSWRTVVGGRIEGRARRCASTRHPVPDGPPSVPCPSSPQRGTAPFAAQRTPAHAPALLPHGPALRRATEGRAARHRPVPPRPTTGAPRAHGPGHDGMQRRGAEGTPAKTRTATARATLLRWLRHRRGRATIPRQASGATPLTCSSRAAADGLRRRGPQRRIQRNRSHTETPSPPTTARVQRSAPIFGIFGIPKSPKIENSGKKNCKNSKSPKKFPKKIQNIQKVQRSPKKSQRTPSWQSSEHGR